MKQRFFIYLILSALLLSGCRSVSGTVQTGGVLRAATESERRLNDLAADQQAESASDVLSSLPTRWNTTFLLNNGSQYTCNAEIVGGNISDCISFNLIERTFDVEILKRTLMEERAEQAILKADPSAEGQQYWEIFDPINGQSREVLQYYVYGESVPDLLNYRHDILVYDNQNSEIFIDDTLPTITDEEAITIAAKSLSKLGYSGMTVLNGYNYQTEVTFYVLPQYTALPVIANSENISNSRIKISVCNNSVSELNGSGVFRVITNREEASVLMCFEGILALAQAHLEKMEKGMPPISEVSLRHFYAYDEASNMIHANLVWFFSIPPVETESAFGVGQQNFSFAIDAVSGVVYGGFL